MTTALFVEPQLPPCLVDVPGGEDALVGLLGEAASCHLLEVELPVHVAQAQRHRYGGLLREHAGQLHEDGGLADAHTADQQIGTARLAVAERLGHHLGQLAAPDDPVDERPGRGDQLVRAGACLPHQRPLGLVVPVQKEDRQEERAGQHGAHEGLHGAEPGSLPHIVEPRVLVLRGVVRGQRDPAEQQRGSDEGEHTQQPAERDPPGVPPAVGDDAPAGLPAGPVGPPAPPHRSHGP
ncbi:hypothetical protein ACFZAB_04710 [Streptomyces albogriseolus]|uniref:hypothetical protein n=1 Tax=Streptomyces albogriseolus TaxID=1887 RepID=UPI0036EBE619